MVENFAELDISVREFLAERGWTEARIANMKTMLDGYAAACETRDSATRLSRQQNAELARTSNNLEDLYRSYTRQARSESGDDALGQKLKAAAEAL